MAIGIEGFLRRKYDIMGQQAQAGMVSAQAQRTQADTQSRLAPSAIADTQAQAEQRRATTAGMPELNAADVMLRQAQAGLAGANTGNVNMSTRQGSMMPTAGQLNAMDARTGARPLLDMSQEQPRRISPATGQRNLQTQPLTDGVDDNGVRIRRGGMMQTRPMGFAKGTARVPGKGSPKKDTVKAKLAPGEAVLNAEAAETMGRGLISALNAVGAQKMGLA